jgi:hypothetical protein
VATYVRMLLLRPVRALGMIEKQEDGLGAAFLRGLGEMATWLRPNPVVSPAAHQPHFPRLRCDQGPPHVP